MKTPTKGMLQFDFIVQSLVYLPTVLLYLLSALNELPQFANGWNDLFIYALLLQVPLGGTQLLSGLVRSIRHGSSIRKKYLMACGVYFAALFTIANIASGDFLIIGTLIGPPMIIATAYYVLTYLQLTGRFEDNGSSSFFSEKASLVLDELDEDERRLLEIQERQRARRANS
ncbi:hypothetical protein [Saprospira grandis]|nr:hypothetical protein [Saprospira grandis]